ncbi:MAG: hypothetical protein EOP74_00205 [Variovorax sp.]|nr:MAG: hypothetical protein EOP74_00205 [Variovorax sp.]
MAKLRLNGNPATYDTADLCRYARDGDKRALKELTKRAQASAEVRALLRDLIRSKAKDAPLSPKQSKSAAPTQQSPWDRVMDKRGRGWVSITSGGLPSLGKKR